MAANYCTWLVSRRKIRTMRISRSSCKGCWSRCKDGTSSPWPKHGLAMANSCRRTSTTALMHSVNGSYLFKFRFRNSREDYTSAMTLQVIFPIFPTLKRVLQSCFICTAGETGRLESTIHMCVFKIYR